MTAVPTGSGDFDPITLEVFQSALITAAREMGEALRRSAYSPIIREMLDYSCAVFDHEGEMVAQSEDIPALLGAMTFALRHLLGQIATVEMAEGDAFVTNDPYGGSSHTPDIAMFKPVFAGRELIGFCGTIAHHVDVGGRNPGTEGFDNSSIFEEGLRLPGVRLLAGGESNDALLKVIAANVRDPRSTLGDLRAQLAACQFGGRRLIALADRYGLAELRRLMETVKDHAERHTRAELAALPDGEATAVGYLDDNGLGGDPVAIHVRVAIAGETVTVDFAGTAPQVAGGMNVPRASTAAAVLYAVKSLIDPDGPQNQGCFRAIEMLVPEGSILNPSFPAAVSLRHLAAQRTVDTILRAFAELVPERSAAGTFVGFSSIAVEAHHPRSGHLTVLQDDLGGGMGGHRYGDGLDAVDTHLGNVGMLPAEICEIEYPVRILATELRAGSAGQGTFRGGLGIRRVYEFLAPAQKLVAYTDQADARFHAWGLAGGGGGERARLRFVAAGQPERELTKELLVAHAGDRLIVETGGGGGWGDPEARAPASREADESRGIATDASRTP